MTAMQMTFIKKWARRWAKRSQSSYRETFQDFMQEALFAEWRGTDPLDAVKQAWKYWEFGNRHHGRVKFDKPLFVEPQRLEHSRQSIEGKIIHRDLLKKIWQRVGKRARAAMKANYMGMPYVWRPEVKAELLQAASSLEGK